MLDRFVLVSRIVLMITEKTAVGVVTDTCHIDVFFSRNQATDSHLIAGQGAGLVRANDSHGAEGLHSG